MIARLAEMFPSLHEDCIRCVVLELDREAAKAGSGTGDVNALNAATPRHQDRVVSALIDMCADQSTPVNVVCYEPAIEEISLMDTPPGKSPDYRLASRSDAGSAQEEKSDQKDEVENARPTVYAHGTREPYEELDELIASVVHEIPQEEELVDCLERLWKLVKRVVDKQDDLKFRRVRYCFTHFCNFHRSFQSLGMHSTSTQPAARHARNSQFCAAPW